MRGMVKKLLCGGSKNFASSRTSALPEEGKVRVYVGKDKESQCKLEVEANLLNHPMFEDLLRLSEEEYGHSYEGALRIACDIDVFINLINLLKTTHHHNPSL
ncbi:hypothetical protein BRARA_I01732 [Brassica rapa]|uniref:Auxin-responsive family protein n=2 Tax=Brassica TaxID=3705 RepID=A0A397XUK4_BRACM|nr:auxin-responsive protein SAUR71 [Brassica napus]RID44971.1 hypothetical protein BRARA_I01732 [Brassica rapa]CAF2041119.1 unnamed protein product [Brassica napus]CAG7861655.1 unnamed protein product [Brassica rapa]CDY52302.1 BnaA09g16140D [Brassica napus]VDC59968.1 unnamed protein product [Brassica rapa]